MKDQREYLKQYRKDNAESIKEKDAARYLKNKEARRRQNKAYCEKHKERISATRKAQYAENKEEMRWRKIFQTHGVTKEWYYETLAEQGGACAICGTTNPNKGRAKWFSVDHDHDTGAIRGLLCTSCNTGLGLLQDSQRVLVSATDYLNKHGRRD